MAFPISHLPRRTNPQDISSHILNKIDSATEKTLNVVLASSWLTELDNTIKLTKERIHDRIHSDLPNFDRQLESSKSVQTRLQSLISNVDSLSRTVSDPETGLVPTLINALTSHATLAQNSSDANIIHESLSYLLQCRTHFRNLSSLVQEGKLPQAVDACDALEILLDKPPKPLDLADVMLDLRRNCRALKDRIAEQLSEAYSRSIVISPLEIIIRPSVQIRGSRTVLQLASILSSLTPSALSAHLTALRRDLTTHYVDRILQQPTSITSPPSESEYKLTLSAIPLESERIRDRLANLSIVLDFLSARLLPSLPPSQSLSFPRSLCKPLVTALLDHLLVPSLPSSFTGLPLFLDLVKGAVQFEEEYVVQMLGQSSKDKDVKTWADAVGGHYERKRRVEILDKVRDVVIGRRDEGTFTVEFEVEGQEKARDFKEVTEEQPDEDGWGFDDDDAELEPKSTPELRLEDEDPADAWGWNDEEEVETVAEPQPQEDDSAWDDPWNEPENSGGTAPLITKSPPKRATRLEKFSSKGRGKEAKTNGHSPAEPSLSLPLSVSTTPPSTKRQVHVKPPTMSIPTKETCIVSLRTKEVIRIIEDVLREQHELSSSSIFSFPTSSSSLGAILLQTASSSLDLWRALYPVVFATDLKSPGKSMQFSNDCLYLSGEIGRIEKATGKEIFVEGREALKILGNSWFDDNIDTRCQTVDAILSAAEGFAYTAEQDRYDECENSLSRVVQEIRNLGRQWKDVLVESKYYMALGLVVDAALSRILEDILALPDIPEVESHRLSELCRILNSLEGLFVKNADRPSFVVAYVPSWLKFSYLSELLEASMADITYLFEEGGLIDFEVDELVKLVKALFADTPLRTNTIGKFMSSGHPIRQ